ncbi:hypothetical protein D9M68_734780 [compost metagenome]
MVQGLRVEVGTKRTVLDAKRKNVGEHLSPMTRHRLDDGGDRGVTARPFDEFGHDAEPVGSIEHGFDDILDFHAQQFEPASPCTRAPHALVAEFLLEAVRDQRHQRFLARHVIVERGDIDAHTSGNVARSQTFEASFDDDRPGGPRNRKPAFITTLSFWAIHLHDADIHVAPELINHLIETFQLCAGCNFGAPSLTDLVDCQIDNCCQQASITPCSRPPFGNADD